MDISGYPSYPFLIVLLIWGAPAQGHFYESQIVRGKREVEILVTLPAPFAAGGVINKQALRTYPVWYIYLHKEQHEPNNI